MAQVFIFFTFVVTAVLCDNPIVEITTTDPPLDAVEGVIIQNRGKDVQLTCVVENKPRDSEVQWTVENAFRNGSTVQIATATRSYDAFKWSIDQPSPTAWRLRVQNAQVTDEGIYTCKVEVAAQNSLVSEKELRVIQIPEIADLDTSTDMTFNAGDTAKLQCFATGRPKPTVEWSRLAGELLPNGGTALRSNILSVESITSDHAGIYKCTAFSSAGLDERRILITVYFRPKVTTSTPLTKQKEGYVKQLVCNVKGYPLPAPNQIAWRRENQPIIHSERLQIRHIPGAYNRITSILDIRGVQQKDYGRYTCSAINVKGSAEVTMELDVSPRPTEDRSGRITAGTSHIISSIILSILMLFSVCLLHQFRSL